MGLGIFSDDQLKELVSKGIIFSEEEIEGGQIQPSSIDLRLGSEIHAMPFSSSHLKGMNMENFLRENHNYSFNLESSGFLHRGIVYVAKLQEGLKLPEHIRGRVNPKSSIGRTDVHVRAITGNGGSFDEIPPGYTGNIWVEIYSRSFDIWLTRGLSLNQLRLGDAERRCISKEELKVLQRDSGLLNKIRQGKAVRLEDREFSKCLGDGEIYTTLLLDSENPGYVAKKNAPLVDFRRRDLPASAYFDRIKLRSMGGFIADPDSFYILSSREIVSVPEGCCAEMTDIETSAGEFRSHYAGFFDPGFSAQATLELRNYGQPILMLPGQRIAGLKYFQLKNRCARSYGEGIGSNYQNQRGPKLAKFFDVNK
jgi:dCTP deaminase